jgi:hypothetical protein
MADQGEVWAQLVCKADELDVDTPTGAMRDVYARHEIDMAPARQALAAQPGQVGRSSIWGASGWGSTSWPALGCSVAPGPGSARAMWPTP